MRLVLILLFSIFIVELGIMALILALPLVAPHGWVAALIDASVLSALLFPVLFFVVFRPLARHIKELEQAETALRAVHDQLELRVQERTVELEQRNREISLLAEMSDFLQACDTAAEAYGVITRTGQQLFPGTMGVLFVYSPSRNDLEGLASWGELALNPNERVFAPDDCWALRRGRMYRLENPRTDPSCRHVPSPPPGKYLCAPMIAQGEVLGVMHLRQNRLAAKSADSAAPLNERLAVALAEHAAVAVINLKLRETLRNQSIHDPLTGLFNRRYMEETLEREIGRAERSQGPLGVVMLDLDHFKHFNDTYGHDAGDLLLRDVGTLLNTQIRGGDIACRYGGDEFTLILPEMPLDIVRERVEALRLGIKQLNVRHLGQSLGTLTVSAGIAMFPEHGADGATLLRPADRALYRAKAEGRDRVAAAETPAGQVVGRSTASRYPPDRKYHV
jgi:diguanylate cyclase (GGDEF)-like protein